MVKEGWLSGDLRQSNAVEWVNGENVHYEGLGR